MKDYIINGKTVTLTVNPEASAFSVACGSKIWRSAEFDPYLVTRNHGTLKFSQAVCEASEYVTGTVTGVKAVYSGFPGCGILVKTFTYLERTNDRVCMDFFVCGDEENDIVRVFWPAPIEFSRPDGFTVLPKMQGILLPVSWDGPFAPFNDGMMFSRDFYMNFAGQLDGRNGYMILIDTPWDANCAVDHKAGEHTLLSPNWRPSLGHIAPADKRRLIYRFFEDADYNTFAQAYRQYVKEQGNLVTLKQKIAANENVAYLLGAPIVHDGVCQMIKPGTAMYREDDPSFNNWFVQFEEIGRRMKKIRELGFEKAYLHLDGWGKSGYDRQHPDIFPPCENCGGAEGMAALGETCRELGFRFGIHDQYRDYYLDADTYDLNNVAVDCDGNYPVYNVWYGGEQTFLCPSLQPEYVRRNYDALEAAGIKLDGSYLDVFAIVDLDECFNEEHKITRKDCVRLRRECFGILSARGIITSSEEPADLLNPAIALVHHAPIAVEPLGSEDGTAMGIPIPLQALVYHDCVVVPWFDVAHTGGWCLPKNMWGFLLALMTGGTVYVYPDMDEEAVKLAKIALKSQARLATVPLLKHEFLDGGYTRQRTTFADGTVITVDFAANEYDIQEGTAK